jgi:hypothetical protein
VAGLVPVLMRLPLNRVRAVIEPGGALPASDSSAQRQIIEGVNLALDLLHPLLRPTCLTRGVTRYYFLRRAGLNVSLAFGIRPTTEAVGHCWLMLDGQPFLETRDPRTDFTEIYRISV